MCTLSLISKPVAAGAPRAFRLVTNRDEQRTRPLALPARTVTHDGLDAWWPIDAQSGGTWIGVNATGLAMGLLNVKGDVNEQAHAPRPAQEPLRSRGIIIPSLLGSSSLAIAISRARDLAFNSFPPFRLIMTDGNAIVELHSDGKDATTAGPISWHGEPRMWTSSSLGDQRVEGPRRELFERIVSNNPSPEAQDAFHHTRWPDRPHLSPMMDRSDARTVSVTTLDITLASPPLILCTEESVPATSTARVTTQLSPVASHTSHPRHPDRQLATHHESTHHQPAHCRASIASPSFRVDAHSPGD